LNLAEYAKRIEESAANLSGAGPWSNPVNQIISLDEAVGNSIRMITKQKDIDLQIKAGCPGLHVSVNPVAFQRVIRQLVRNADQAMAKMPEKKILVHTRPINATAEVEIVIQDFGPGIPAEVRTSILHRRISTKGKGGYGLMFARQMVEGMGGKIKLLSSEQNEGAAFSIRFPVIQDSGSTGLHARE
jgi:signal transduction histidine kinase